MRALLLAGADKVSFNTAAVATPEVISAAPRSSAPSASSSRSTPATVAPGRWEIFTHGGTRATGIDAVGFAREMERRGAGEILLTSMDRDGTRAGYDLRADPRGRRRGRHPGDRLAAASGRSSIWSRA